MRSPVRACTWSERASTVAIQFEDITMAAAVTELGAHAGFKVVDLAAAGRRSSCTLWAVSVVGLLGQLLPAGGYAVTYRADGGGSEVINKVLLLPASRRADSADERKPLLARPEDGASYRRATFGPSVGAGRSEAAEVHGSSVQFAPPPAVS